MSENNSTLSKVRKLLALAEDPAATPAEATAFTAKATQLMADYGIDQALLAGKHADPSEMGDLTLRFVAPYARDKCSLACGIASEMRCKAVILGGDAEVSVHIFGLRSDLMLVDMLTTSLLLQGSRELALTPIPGGQNIAAYRRTWWAGYAAAIKARLAEAERSSERAAADRDGSSVALVLADRTHEAEAAMHAAYPRLRTAARRRLSGGGVHDGFSSGQRADIARAKAMMAPGRSELTG